MTPVTSREAGEGEYIGSGEGTVKGPRIHGTIRWDLFEKREATLLWRFGIQQPKEDQMGFLSNLLGGRAAADKCSVCGSKFSATPSKSSDLMALVIAQRGLVCGKCGRLYCMECAGKDSKGSLVCRCGGNLGFRD
jgi:hypothetical protein